MVTFLKTTNLWPHLQVYKVNKTTVMLLLVGRGEQGCGLEQAPLTNSGKENNKSNRSNKAGRGENPQKVIRFDHFVQNFFFSLIITDSQDHVLEYQERSIPVGDTITLVCDHNNREIEVYWEEKYTNGDYQTIFRDDISFYGNNKKYVNFQAVRDKRYSNLTITNADVCDDGQYICKAEEEIIRYRLIVNGGYLRICRLIPIFLRNS